MTFGTLKARIADEMKRGELTASAPAVQSSIIDAIKYFESRRFAFNQFIDATHTTTADSPYVTLTATLQLVQIDSVKVTIGSRNYPLSAASWVGIDSIDSGQWSGYPEYYCQYDVDNTGSTQQRLRFYPIPNNTYTVTIAGVKKLPEISAGASTNATNAWVDVGEEMVRMRAKGTLFRDQLRAPEHAQSCFADAEMYARTLHGEAIRTQSTGRLNSTRGGF
jgi:hypothetical protein